MDELAMRTGRAYRLVDYVGAPDAERVLVLMGSGVGAATEAVEALVGSRREGRRARRAPLPALPRGRAPRRAAAHRPLGRRARPHEGARRAGRAAVRGRDPGARPRDQRRVACATMPLVIGGRYGLSSKEFTPAMAKAALDELDRRHPAPGSSPWASVTTSPTCRSTSTARSRCPRARCRRSSGAWEPTAPSAPTRRRSRSSASTPTSGPRATSCTTRRKSGAVTTSHLRFGPDPIRSTYLIDGADFVACHQWSFLDRPVDLLGPARPGATFLLNSPYPAEEVWDHLPLEIQEEIVAKGLDLWVIDANRVAQETGMANRINTVMQPCFFALSGVLPSRRGDRRHQGERRARLRQARPRDRGAEPRRRSTPPSTPCERVTVPSTASSTAPPPTGGGGRSTRLRAADHGEDARGRGRPAPGERAPRRRHLPDRHRPLGATHDRHRAPRLGSRDLHRLRQVRDLVPAHRHPDEGLRARR